MKAYYSIAYGNSGTSAFGDLPEPVAGPGQVLVEIKAASINPVDWKIKRGKKLMSSNMRSRDEDWRELERLYAEGSFSPVIENVSPLERSSDAFDLAMRGGFRGKIIVTT